MQGLVKCRGCGWVWESVSVGMGYTRCRCGSPATAGTMEPTDGSGLPIGVTINGIVVCGPLDASSTSLVVTQQAP